MNETDKDMGGLFLVILFAVFAALKTSGIISWSWWWVTAPLWMPFAIYIGCAILLVVWAMFMLLWSLFL